MKLLWVKTDFLHPTTRGGQIRTLETLRRLHAKHEVHYIGLDDGTEPEGPARAKEYCSFHYAIPHRAPDKASLGFVAQLAAGVLSAMPVPVARWQSAAMKREIDRLASVHRFDSIVCDFLFPAPNISDLARCTLFQHNVEAQIWRRHTERARTPLHGWYFGMQARKMAAFEGEVCRKVRNVIAVSPQDAQQFRDDYGVKRVDAVPTGVDIEYFRRPAAPELKADLVFVGSMDWLPNTDGVRFFLDEVLPRIRNRRRDCTVAIVGRKPSPEILRAAEALPGVTVTGTVDDVRPWLHGSRVSIVPLRIGGGTRLKIYEAMAAGVPVVSTAVGAEGLDYRAGETIQIGDSAEDFANRCLALLDDPEGARQQAERALSLVASRYSWSAVSDQFEDLLL